MRSEENKNTFEEGLNLDSNILSASNKGLSDALNATLITMNGNEFVLQNDMGNAIMDKLSENFIPVGLKEFGGVIYVASYNPKTGQGEIGTFPSPSELVAGQIPYSNNISFTQTEFADKNNYISNISLGKWLMPGDGFEVSFTIAPNIISTNLNFVTYLNNITPQTNILSFNICTLDKNNVISTLNNVNFNCTITNNVLTYSTGSQIYKGKKAGKLILVFTLESLNDFTMILNTDKDASNNYTLDFSFTGQSADLIKSTKGAGIYSKLGIIENYLNVTQDTYFPRLQITGTGNEIINYTFTPYLQYGKLNEWTINSNINTAHIGSGNIDLYLWKYIILDSYLCINWGINHYPKNNSDLITPKFLISNVFEQSEFIELPNLRDSKKNWTGEYLDKYMIGEYFDLNKLYIAKIEFGNTTLYKLISTYNLYSETQYLDETIVDYDITAQPITLLLSSTLDVNETTSKKVSPIIQNSSDTQVSEFGGFVSQITAYNVSKNGSIKTNNSALVTTALNIPTTIELNNATITNVNIGGGGSQSLTINKDDTLTKEANRNYTYLNKVFVEILGSAIKLTQISDIIANAELKSISLNNVFVPYMSSDSDDNSRMEYLFGSNPYKLINGSYIPTIDVSWGIQNHGYRHPDSGLHIAEQNTHSETKIDLVAWTNYGSTLSRAKAANIDTLSKTGDVFIYDENFNEVLKMYSSFFGTVKPQILFVSGRKAYNITDNTSNKIAVNAEWESIIYKKLSDLNDNYTNIKNKYSNWVTVQWKTNSVDDGNYIILDLLTKSDGNADYNVESNYTKNTAGAILALHSIFNNIYVAQKRNSSITKYIPGNNCSYNSTYDVNFDVTLTTNYSNADTETIYDSNDTTQSIILMYKSKIDSYSTLDATTKNAIKSAIDSMFTFTRTFNGNSSISKSISKTSADISSNVINFLSPYLNNELDKVMYINNSYSNVDKNGELLDVNYAYQIINNEIVKIIPNSKIYVNPYTMWFNFDVSDRYDYRTLLFNPISEKTTYYVSDDTASSHSREQKDRVKLELYKLIS